MLLCFATGFRNILIKGLLDYITVLVVGLVLLMAIVAIDYTQLEGRIINGSSCEGEEEDLFTVDCFGNHPIDFGRLKQMSGRSKSPSATENLPENTDGGRSTPSLFTVLSGQQPATLYVC